ncbi:MAG: hypothetical protein OEM15_02355 [Myxococcales bacterium]|nr:hypothetical protein [Myxococcales bacterium]MDH3485270.1 hypothetical protein [Myxococcales bacterium]
MKKRRILLSIVFGSMLAITGCGGDGDGDGTGATNGTGATGGGGDGPATSTCEAICGSTCAFEGVDPTNMEFEQCVSSCNQSIPQFNDDCGSEGEAYLNCLEDNECDDMTQNCNSQAIDWGTCIAGAFQ